MRGHDATTRTAGGFALPIGLLGQVPRADATEVLNLVPGVSITNEATAGDPPEVYLRGFTGENGQDIAFSVEGVPLNEESNPLTHGTADLYFVIPELVDELDVTEGLADPRQGNFALAGSVNYRLGLATRGITVRGALGTQGYRRLAAFYGPAQATRQTFVGVELVHSDGFGPSRSYDRMSALAQHAIPLGNGLVARVMAGGYAGRWTNPGVVRQDDVDAGRVDFFGVYPNTGNQGGYSTRALLGATLDWTGSPTERAQLRVFGQLRDFREDANDDGFAEDPVHGDLLSERYSGGTLGANGYYRRGLMVGGRLQELEVGFSVRHDRYAVHEQRLDVATNAPTTPPNPDDNSAELHVTNPAVYLEATVRPLAWLTLRGGLRLDALAYDVDVTTLDDAGAATTAHRNAFGTHLGPKATVILGPLWNLQLLASYGTGFRGPDARAISDGVPLDFTTAATEDVTLRYVAPGSAGSPRWTASLTGFHTTVDQDEIFDPTRGTTVAVGPTDRLGAMAWLRIQPVPWIDVNAWVTYTHSTVQQDALGGQLAAGSAIPYLPAVVGHLDAGVDRQVATWRAMPIRVRGGLAASLRAAEAMISTPYADPVFLLDASAGVRVGYVGFDLSARNLLDARWHSANFEYVSNFNRGTPTDDTPARHFVAGAPFTLFGTLSVYL